LYVLFSKFVPIISIWELKVGRHPDHGLPEAAREERQALWRTQP
jgi:hypothetical protein